MPKFICSGCGYTLYNSNTKFKSVDGKFVPDIDTNCPMCHEGVLTLDESNVSVGDICVEVAKFDSLSDGDKKAMLKKRAKQDFDKNHKQAVESKRNDMLNDIKRAHQNGEL